MLSLVPLKNPGRVSRPTPVLYLCYLGVNEPLVQTQVIPYLAGLATAHYGLILVTFDAGVFSDTERKKHRDRLRDSGIEWHTLRYHKRPALPATLFDIVSGVVCGARLIRTRRISIVHARSYVPAAMAVVLKWLLGIRFIFDIRGLLADEYVDAGLWRPGGVLYRLVKRMEHLFVMRADAAIVLTNRARRWLFEPQGRPNGDLHPVEVIPCCVDLDRFVIDPDDVQRLRSLLGFEGRPVMAYAGKFGGWYMARETVDFFCVARRRFPNLHFLVLTQSDRQIIAQELEHRNIGTEAYTCLTVAPDDVPEYLALADFAVCFIKPCVSKIASSPTKVAEYLAAGMPVVYNTGIGDLDALEKERVGVPVTAFSDCQYGAAVGRLSLLLNHREQTSKRCRAVARERFSLSGVGIPRYLRLYARLNGVVPSDA